MDNIEKLINKYALVSDQINQKELATVLEALQLTLDKHIGGDVVEFGCYKGTTSLFLMRLIMASGQQKRLWLYDSFQGLPDKTAEDGTIGDEFRPGELAATKAEVVRNFAHANLPKTIIKKVNDILEISEKDIKNKKENYKKLSKAEKDKLIKNLTKEMKLAAQMLEFEHAAFLRDEIQKLR